jgi:hypothetical protein
LRRSRLGNWTLPSGNAVDAYLIVEAGDVPVYSLVCEWEYWPPSDQDRQFYTVFIAPQIAQRVQRCLVKGNGKVVYAI